MAANYSTVDYSTADYYGTGTLPMPVPTGGKATAYPYYNSGDSTYSVSPPEGDASVSSGTGGVASYGAPSSYAGGSSYAGSSNGDYDSAASAGNVDLQEYMQDRFTHQFDAVALDRAVATQTKTSGTLNNKSRELAALQAKTQARLAKARARFAEGAKDARKVQTDLEYVAEKVSRLEIKAASKHSKEYQKARARYPTPDSDF